MKTRSILTAAVLLIGSSANAQTVVHYWDFESPNDVVGGLTTVMVGAADLSIHAGYGIAYTGSGQSLNSTTLGGAYLEADVHDGIAATALDFGMSDWSFSYWSFNPTDGDARGPRIFDALVNTTVGMQLGTDFLGQLDLRLEDDLGNDAVAPPPVVIQPTDSWIHVVVNVDRTNDSADFYFNNVLQGSMSLTALAGNLAPTQDLQIGVINNGNPSMGSQDGGLDDLAFYEGLLDASDRAGLANGTLTPLAFTGPSSGLCAGDGGNQMGCTDCPCGNNAPLGAGGGCINSSGSGTELQSSGDPSISLPDGAVTDLQFSLVGAPPTATCVLISGDNVAPQGMANPCFGLDSGILSTDRDGLRCVVGSTLRHGNRQSNTMGEIQDSSGPSRVWGGPAQPTAGIGATAGFVAGQTRYFQITHRDIDGAICPPGTGLNTSQAVGVTFTP